MEQSRQSVTGATPRIRYAHGAGSVLIVLPLLLPLNAVQAAVTTVPSTLDAGTVFQTQQQQPASLFSRKREKVQLRASMPPLKTDNNALKLSIGGFRLEGESGIGQEVLQKVMAPWQGRELSFGEFEEAVQTLAEYLRTHGHPRAQVSMNQALLGDGMVAIAVQGLTLPPEPVLPQVLVKGFGVSGVTLASRSEIDSLLQDRIGKPLTVAELEASAQKVAEHLRAKGYPLVQAYLPPQRIEDGVIQIAVQEGPLDGASGINGIVIRNNPSPVSNQRVAALLAEGAPAGSPVKAVDLERALLIAGDVPGIKRVQAELTPGSLPGTTRVEADVESAGRISGAAWVDNHGDQYSGEYRLNTQLNLNSPLGFGEQLSLNAGKSDNLRSGKLALLLPVGNRGAKVGVSVSNMSVDMGVTTLVPRNLSGDTTVESLFGSIPLQRSAQSNITLAANLDSKHMRNSLDTLMLDDRKITMLTVGLNGDRYDSRGGRIAWSGSLSLGHNDLSGNAGYEALDQASAKTGGDFAKVNLAFSRLSQLDAAGTYQLGLSLNAQLANKNLDNSEKLQLGGPNGVRAYPLGEGLGDNGWLASAEVRRNLGKFAGGDVSAFAFVDAGGVTQYNKLWDGAVASNRPNSYTLAGAGVGVRLSYDNKGALSLTVANKLGSNPNKTQTNTDADGRNRSARIWVIGNIAF